MGQIFTNNILKLDEYHWREKRPNTEFVLVHILLHFDWMLGFME